MVCDVRSDQVALQRCLAAGIIDSFSSSAREKSENIEKS